MTIDFSPSNAQVQLRRAVARNTNWEDLIPDPPSAATCCWTAVTIWLNYISILWSDDTGLKPWIISLALNFTRNYLSNLVNHMIGPINRTLTIWSSYKSLLYRVATPPKNNSNIWFSDNIIIRLSHQDIFDGDVNDHRFQSVQRSGSAAAGRSEKHKLRRSDTRPRRQLQPVVSRHHYPCP